MDKPLDWKVDTNLPAGKGATVQRFTASDRAHSLEIDTRPWGEGDLIIDGIKRAHVQNEKNEQDAFKDLEAIAEQSKSKD
jgi:hypothetical protein